MDDVRKPFASKNICLTDDNENFESFVERIRMDNSIDQEMKYIMIESRKEQLAKNQFIHDSAIKIVKPIQNNNHDYLKKVDSISKLSIFQNILKKLMLKPEIPLGNKILNVKMERDYIFFEKIYDAIKINIKMYSKGNIERIYVENDIYINIIDFIQTNQRFNDETKDILIKIFITNNPNAYEEYLVRETNNKQKESLLNEKILRHKLIEPFLSFIKKIGKLDNKILTSYDLLTDSINNYLELNSDKINFNTDQYVNFNTIINSMRISNDNKQKISELINIE